MNEWDRLLPEATPPWGARLSAGICALFTLTPGLPVGRRTRDHRVSLRSLPRPAVAGTRRTPLLPPSEAS